MGNNAMRQIITSILTLFACASTFVLAAAGEGGQLAPEPTVSVGWVYFFVIVFFAVCVWFGFAIWSADRKNRAAAAASEKS